MGDYEGGGLVLGSVQRGWEATRLGNHAALSSQRVPEVTAAPVGLSSRALLLCCDRLSRGPGTRDRGPEAGAQAAAPQGGRRQSRSDAHGEQGANPKPLACVCCEAPGVPTVLPS